MNRYCSISLQGVTIKQESDYLLNPISFTLNAGAHLALFGPSGSGKSLLARALNGSIDYSGSITFEKNGKLIRPKIAYLPVNDSRKERLQEQPGRDNSLFEELCNYCSSETADNWLHTFLLLPKKQTPVSLLSGGEFKKFQLICQLIAEPEVMIIDNGFAGLDVKSRKVLHRVLNERAVKGTTLILITDSHELPACITHFAEMAEGTMIRMAPVEQMGFMESFQWNRIEAPLPPLKKAYHIGPVISMKNGSIHDGDTPIISDINWQVNSGECWQIKGGNGAGKSLLLGLISGNSAPAYPPQLTLLGRKAGTADYLHTITTSVGFVAPELSKKFNTAATVMQVVGTGYSGGFNPRQALNEIQNRKVTEWLRFFSLEHKAGTAFDFLSDGEQRLVLIARALIKKPSLLILDDPCLGLDDGQSKMIIQLTERIHKETGMTLLFTTHYDDQVPLCVKHILELNGTVTTVHKKNAAYSINPKLKLTRQMP